MQVLLRGGGNLVRILHPLLNSELFERATALANHVLEIGAGEPDSANIM